MLHLAWPWVLAALPLPLLLHWLWPSKKRVATGRALRVPFFSRVQAREASARRGLSRILILMAWCALVVAAARPQWVNDPLAMPVTGRELLLAVDLSGSMGEKDEFRDGQRLDRLAAVKKIAGDFIEKRVGDRVGLILFGSRPYVQVPLTFDRAMAAQLLDEAVVGLAGGETAIGDAIGLAVRILRERPAQSRVAVLLTDGENNAGVLDPIDAARLAELHGLRIHTIGLGGARQQVEGATGSSAGLDEKTLETIASITGGSHFTAANAEALDAVYRIIDELEPAADKEDIVRPADEIFYWPLAFAYALGVVGALGVLLPGIASTAQSVLEVPLTWLKS